MTTEDLAHAVLEMMAGQTAYFAARRTMLPEECQSLLIASKAREKAVKAACEAIVRPPKADLFTGSDR